MLDEDLVGYLRRLAMNNGHAGWRDMVRAVDFKPTKTVVENDLSTMLLALGIPMDDVQPWYTAATSKVNWKLHKRTRTDPVCVCCLQESEHLRRAWSHCLVVACPHHQCQLIDRCPGCGEMLENSRTGIAICDCGFDLRYATRTEATPMQCWSSARVTGDMQPIRPVDEIGTEEDYRHLDDLLFHLAIRFDPSVKIKRGAAKRPQHVDDVIAFLRPVLELFEDLQSRLPAHIAARFEAGNQNAFNLTGRLGAWYIGLDLICRKTRTFPIIWEIFSDSVFDNFDGFIRGQAGLTPSTTKQRQFLGVAEAAKLIGVSKPILQEAIERKQIRVRTGCQGINYAVHMISREQCDAARKLRSNSMTASEACTFLGIPKSILQHFVNADIAKPDQQWNHTIFKVGPFSKEQLTGIREKMDSAIQVRAASRTFRLDQIDARRTVDLKALVRIYRAIFSGDINPIGRSKNEGLAGLLFPADEVKRYLGTAALDSGLTLSQLALATGWKYQSVAGWASQSLLESETVVLQGRRSRVVTVEGLANFRREWIPVSEVASAMGSKGSAVTKHLESKGVAIYGQTHESNGAVRGGLIRISDLGRLAGLVGSISRKSIEPLRGENVV